MAQTGGQSNLFNFFKVTKEKRSYLDLANNLSSLSKPKGKKLKQEKKPTENKSTESATQPLQFLINQNSNVIAPLQSPQPSYVIATTPLSMMNEVKPGYSSEVNRCIRTVNSTSNYGSSNAAHVEQDRRIKRYSQHEDENTLTSSVDVVADDGLSAYELLRLERIKKNSEYLDSLGLESVKIPVANPTPARSNLKKKKKTIEDRPRSEPVRRSTRNVISVSNDDLKLMSTGCVSKRIISDEEKFEEEQFEDSHALSYLISNDNPSKSRYSGGVEIGGYDHGYSLMREGQTLHRMKLGGWEPLNQDGTKTKWYSIDCDMRSGLIVAGGQGGRVSTFRLGSCVEDGPLCSFKPHGSTWVSDVQFCGEENGKARGSLLLTSANDGNVMVWDMTKQALRSTAPKQVCKQAWHRSGIWSMHTAKGSITTGSKDGCVGFGVTTSTGARLNHTEDLDAGHVKGVHIQSTEGHHLVAAACEDGSIKMLDARSPAVSSCLKVTSAHGGKGCVSVEFRPNCSNLLLSAGLDASIKVWDLRNLHESSLSLCGHIPTQYTHRLKQISRPRWLPARGSDRGDVSSWGVIAVQGEYTSKLTLYDAVSGELLSRGELESAATTIASIDDNSPHLAVAFLDGTIGFLVPDSDI